MKKKSTSQSAFFNLRVLVGLFIALAGVSLALLATANPPGRGASAKRVAPHRRANIRLRPSPPLDPLVPAMFDCSKIHQLGIDRHGKLPGRRHHDFLRPGQREVNLTFCTVQCVLQACAKPDGAAGYGATDVDLVTGD